MRASRILILLSVFTFLSFSALTLDAQTATKPDFAYPQTVSRQSEKALTAATERHDGPAIVRALIDYYLAESRIDVTRSSLAIKKIDSIAAITSDPVLKSMLSTLEADIYAALYSSSRWKYDARNLPLTPLPDDYREWSGDQFRMKINSLIDSALQAAPELKAAPLKTYSSVLSLGKSVGVRNEAGI